MYMEPIVRAKPSVSTRRRRLVGAPVLIASGVVMLPWLTVNLAVAGTVLAVRLIARLPRLALTMIDYAGAVALQEQSRPRATRPGARRDVRRAPLR